MISFNTFNDAQRVEESYQQDRSAAKRNTGKRTRNEEIAYGKNSKLNFKFENPEVAFIPGIHGPSQAKDRRPDMSKEDWKSMHRKVYWYLKDNKITKGVFLFYSKSMNQAYIANVGKPRAGDKVKAPVAVSIITVLPKGKRDPRGGSRPGTTSLAMMEVQEFMNEMGLFESIEDIQIVNI